MCATDKSLKAARNTFSAMWSVIRGSAEGFNFFSGGDIQQKGEVQTFGLAGGAPSKSLP